MSDPTHPLQGLIVFPSVRLDVPAGDWRKAVRLTGALLCDNATECGGRGAC